VQIKTESLGSLSRRARSVTRHRCLRASLAGLLALVDGLQCPLWPDPLNAREARASLAASVQTFPSARGDAAQEESDSERDDALVRAQPVCVASSAWFGKLGDSVLYVRQRSGDELRVGYIVYFDVERPWGKNLLTYSVLPATLIDATYSHTLFVLPGLQRLMYGAGDVEGASVLYQVSPTGELAVREGLADDGTHGQVKLTRADLLGDAGHVVLMTNVWSHQLGAHGAAAHARADSKNLRCFSGASLMPLTPQVRQAFRLGSPEHPLRARPAFFKGIAERPSPDGPLASAPARTDVSLQ
jgi:hypothetical protein